MYQVVINDKYYITDVDSIVYMNGTCSLLEFSAVNTRQCGKLFEGKTMALSIAEQVGGKVIEYIEKQNAQVEIKCNIDLEEVCEQIRSLRNEQ